jgi:hypothetical protein
MDSNEQIEVRAIGEGDDPEQQRDKLLLRLVKMPPQSRAEIAERALMSAYRSPSWQGEP